MIHGLVRSPSFYFDITPTGQLNNRFSNDLGVLDSNLFYILTDCLQGLIVAFLFIGNIFSINHYFLIPGIFNIVFVIYFFIYCKDVIIAIKQLELRLKTPVFNMVGEMISGLIQIKIFSQRFYFLS